MGTAMSESIPDENKIATWWRLIGALQGLLLGGVVVSLAWIVALLIFGVFHAAGHAPRLFGDASLLPWIIVLIAAFLMLGWLTATRVPERGARRGRAESERVQQTMRARIGNGRARDGARPGRAGTRRVSGASAANCGSRPGSERPRYLGSGGPGSRGAGQQPRLDPLFPGLGLLPRAVLLPRPAHPGHVVRALAADLADAPRRTRSRGRRCRRRRRSRNRRAALLTR